MAIPEFILKKLYVPDSYQPRGDGFVFALQDDFAPANITGFHLLVDGQEIDLKKISLKPAGVEERRADSLSVQATFPLSIGTRVEVQAHETAPGKKISLVVDTVEVGKLTFQLPIGKQKEAERKIIQKPRVVPAFLKTPLKVSAQVDVGSMIGEISPYVYGQFVEHLERCVYDGLWTADGSALRPDTLRLVEQLKPPLIRYPGGNFASGYHWEDGIGPRSARPERVDKAWEARESNQVGTDEFLTFCEQLGIEPCLVVNDGSGTPDEAARWVAYCNEPENTEQGKRRAANGHTKPYNVRLWGVGNEVWGAWQIGTTGPQEYARRLLEFTRAMRAVDPAIKIVAVGNSSVSPQLHDPRSLWNDVVLNEAAAEIDYLSFHIYQPEQDSWRDVYHEEELHYAVCAAPLDIEGLIGNMSKQIQGRRAGRDIRIALDEWNIWLPPGSEAKSMHQVTYTMRDALYVAGVLNVFHRTCNVLGMANLAQLINVLPLIVTTPQTAYATTIYYPFWMYTKMEKFALRPQVDSPTYDSAKLAENIQSHTRTPYLDITATCSADYHRAAFGLINRHLDRPMEIKIRTSGMMRLNPKEAWVLAADHPLAANTPREPERVKVRPTNLPVLKDGVLTGVLPPSSVTVWTLTE